MPEECTKDLIPEGGVNIFSYIPHMHTAGTSAEFFIIRNGQRIDLIIDNHYDFNY